jgi:ArsR family transcriptional regulator
LITINLLSEGDMAGRIVQQLRKAELTVGATVLAALTALADPVRLRIILMLRERELCVCHLTEGLGLSQGTISHHMGLLKRAGLVEDRRDRCDGRWVYYRLNPNGAAAFQSAIGEILDATRAEAAPAVCGSNDDHCASEGED